MAHSINLETVSILCEQSALSPIQAHSILKEFEVDDGDVELIIELANRGIPLHTIKMALIKKRDG